tara:strand:- start:1042 stop:4809 length:3768 start_codon:yes stop_codon:yes gene_type:complete
MAVLKKYSPSLNLRKLKVFIEDSSSDSVYFNITELERTLTGGKNAFLFEGSSFFKKGSKVRFEANDVNGNPLYIEPGKQGDRTFREGNSIVMAIHIYDDTPIGVGSLSIVAELETYIDERGIERKIPVEFRGIPNIRWTQKFKINPKIPNKTQVRFFKRPTFSVTEIEKPLLVKTEMTLNKSGSVIGIAEVPDTGSDFSTWTAPSQYRIKLQEGNKFTQSMEENTTLQIPSLGYSSSVLEVVNADEMLVRKPYLINNVVHEFQPVSYSLEFESVEDAVVTGSNVTASYAEIRLENLKTFTGDVARIKIFRKSRNDLGDFQVVQENKLDATELLRDFSVDDRTVINYGKLRRENIVSEEGDVYYTTSSGVEIHNDKLINSLEVKGNHSVESAGTIGEFEIVSGSEYSFKYNARYSGSGASVNTDTLRFLIVTSSNNSGNPTVTSQSIDLLSGSIDRNSDGLGNIQRIQKNFFAETTGKCQIRVEANTAASTGRFLFSRLSLKNAEESSYSPDEYTAIVDIPRKNPTEQFDFRVEFYDINNNFIPIKVEQSVPFTKGNQALGLEASINVKNSGIADAGDILSVEGGVVQIASTNIQSSTIAGLGDPTNFSQELAAATSSLQAATQSLELQTQNLQIATASLGADITASNQASAESASLAIIGNTDAVLSASLSASAAQTNAENFATTAANNATLSGSLSASIAITGNENAVLSGSAFATIAGDNSVLSGSAFSADAALSASESGAVDPSTGKLTKTPTPAGSGLFLGSENMGFYDTNQWKTYMSSSGEFFLTGSDANNYLRWNGSTLEIGGSIVLTNGSPSVDLTPLNDFTQSQDSVNTNLNSHTSSYVSQVVLNSSGMALKDTSNNILASYGTRTTIGPTSTEHLAISSSGLELLDGSTARIQLSNTGVQIGSAENGITLSSAGDATFAGDLSVGFTANGGGIDGRFAANGSFISSSGVISTPSLFLSSSGELALDSGVAVARRSGIEDPTQIAQYDVAAYLGQIDSFNGDDDFWGMYILGASSTSDYQGIRWLNNDGSARGSIYSHGNMRVFGTDVDLELRTFTDDFTTGGDVVIYPASSLGEAVFGACNVLPSADNSKDIGSSAKRWDDIFATNGSIQTSDRDLKTNISGSDLGLNFVNSLNPVKYQWISGSSNRTHYGLIAQEVSESLASSSVHTDDFAGYIKSRTWIKTHPSGSRIYTDSQITQDNLDTGSMTYDSTTYGLRYTEMIAPMIKAIQELSAKVTQLENQISGSE